MSVRSMTGFARVRKTAGEGEISISLKSVNHRGLDLHLHLPPELDAIENDIRAAVKSACVRGHVQLQIGWTRAGATTAGLNQPLLAAWLAAFRQAMELYPLPDQKPDLNAALRIPGMLGGGGDADQGLHDGRHRRSHHNQRRRPPARGWAQPPAGVGVPDRAGV